VCLSNELSVTVAIQTLKVVYLCLLDVGCFSHTLDHVLDGFMKVWLGLFTRSPKAKLAWREATSLPVPTYSTTRWGSKREVMKDLLLENSDLPPKLPKASRSKVTNEACNDY